MAFEVQRVKNSVEATEESEPELDRTFQEAREKLEATRENNRHEEELQKRELGWFGGVFGGQQQAPIIASAVVAVLSLFFAFVCVVLASFEPNTSSLDQARNAFLALAASSLSYLFGTRSSSRRR